LYRSPRLCIVNYSTALRSSNCADSALRKRKFEIQEQVLQYTVVRGTESTVYSTVPREGFDHTGSPV